MSALGRKTCRDSEGLAGAVWMLAVETLTIPGWAVDSDEGVGAISVICLRRLSPGCSTVFAAGSVRARAVTVPPSRSAASKCFLG